MRIEETKNIYNRAVEKAKSEKYREAFELYVASFIERLSSIRKREEEFRLFYRYQMAKYLQKKKKYLVSLAEGDMISDLIVSSYDEFIEGVEASAIPLTDQGRRNLLVELKIEYPCQIETEESKGLEAVSN